MKTINGFDATYKERVEKESAILSSVIPLPVASLQKLLAITSIVEYPKGHYLFREGKKNRDVYFMSDGIARVYYLCDTTEVNLLFGTEGEFLISLKSYIENESGYENIELLEPSKLLKITYPDLQHLYETDIAITNWGRKLAERALIETEQRLMFRQFKTASQRYKELIEKQPNLLQRVQLGHIASYLGVSQVTLSRIRAEIK